MYKNDRVPTSFIVEQSHFVACSLALFFFLVLLGDRLFLGLMMMMMIMIMNSRHAKKFPQDCLNSMISF